MQVNEYEGGGRYSNVWAMWIQAYEAGVKASEKTLSKLGISTQEYGLLWVLDHHTGAPTQADIARWLVRETHSVSGLISRMETRGLVYRQQDPNNLRFMRVYSTAKGKHLYERANATRIGLKILSCFTDAELEQFEKLVRKLRKSTLKRLGAKSVVYKHSGRPPAETDGKVEAPVPEKGDHIDQPVPSAV